jgi:hypothetical protein
MRHTDYLPATTGPLIGRSIVMRRAQYSAT